MLSDRLLLLRFLKIHNFDLEEAKKLLLFHLSTRKENPNLFENRIVLGDEFQRVMEYQQIFEMIPRTAENHKVSIFRVFDKPNQYNICEVLRFIVAALDVKLVTFLEDNEDADLHDGEILVNDMVHFGLGNVMQCIRNISMLKSYIKYSQEAVPMKIVENHYVNCTPAFIRMMNFIKPFFNKQVSDSLHFHSSFETLHKMIPRYCLPEEFGGTSGKSDTLSKNWQNIFVDKR